MGYGSYSSDAHDAILSERVGAAPQAVFKQSECHPLMNPKGVLARECRDSAEHPHTTAVVFALDVTGSMGAIPRVLATKELPTFMKVLTACDVPDPQRDRRPAVHHPPATGLPGLEGSLQRGSDLHPDLRPRP